MSDEKVEPQETEEEDFTVTLTDKEGNEHDFTIVQLIRVDEKDYAVLVAVDEEAHDEAVIFRIDQEEGEDVLVEIEDDAEFDRVADAWDAILDADDEDEAGGAQ